MKGVIDTLATILAAMFIPEHHLATKEALFIRSICHQNHSSMVSKFGCSTTVTRHFFVLVQISNLLWLWRPQAMTNGLGHYVVTAVIKTRLHCTEHKHIKWVTCDGRQFTWLSKQNSIKHEHVFELWPSSIFLQSNVNMTRHIHI